MSKGGHYNKDLKVADFLVIANKRSGSSWLNRNLSEHPDIFMTEQKGVHFFDLHFEEGLDFYSRYFQNANINQLKGETEHSYFWDDLVPERIHSTLGTIPMLLTLRQPVDRAWSYFQLRRRFQPNNTDDFEDCFMSSMKQNENMFAWGLYGQQLQKYLNYFPPEVFHYIRFDDIIEQPLRTIQDAYRFLKLDPSFVPPSVDKKWMPATNIGAQVPEVLRYMCYTSLFSDLTRRVLRKIGFKNIVVYRAYSPPPLCETLKRDLTIHYDEDIELLMKLTGLDFSSWLSTSI